MGKYIIEISSRARKELQFHYQSGNKAVIRKIEKIFLELSFTPYKGTGNPEPLKYHLSGYWSRRINRKDRIIYRVFEDRVVVLVVSAIGHYGDRLLHCHSNSFGTPQIILKGLYPLFRYWCFSSGLTRAKSPAFLGGLLSFFIDQGPGALDHVVHVYYSIYILRNVENKMIHINCPLSRFITYKERNGQNPPFKIRYSPRHTRFSAADRARNRCPSHLPPDRVPNSW